MGLLYASEYGIYGRFGYGPATWATDWVIAAKETAMRVAGTGSTELTAPGEASKAAIRGVFEVWRLRRAGEISRRDLAWDIRLGLRADPWGGPFKGWLIVHRNPKGAVDGYARYRANPRWEDNLPSGELEVEELIALNGDAYAGMLRYLLEADLVAKVKLRSRAASEPVRWLLTNARAARSTAISDALWVRLFDVPRALEARTYERRATLVLEVVDDVPDGGTRRLLLDAGPDGATCRSTDRPADLSVPVAALGAAYLGGTRLRDVVLATGADEHRPGALAEADALLRTADEPGCSTFF